MNLRAYQQEANDAIAAKFVAGEKKTLLVLATGCHAKGQGILMHDGSTRVVENIKVGDRLMGPDSRARLVLSLTRGHGQMVRIVPTKGDSFVVNLDHILTLVRTNTSTAGKFPSQRRGGEVVDVSVREWMAWPKHRKHIHKLFRVAVDFNSEEFRPCIDHYTAGVLLGDGSLQRSLGITTADPEIIEVARNLASQFGVSVREAKAGGKSSTWYVSSGKPAGCKGSPLLNCLASDGLRGQHCHNKHVPFRHLTSSRLQRLEMLAGLIDTDGSATGGGYDFISASKQLSNDVAFLARSVGLAAYVSECIKSDQHGASGTYWRVGISGDCAIVPCRIARKRHADRQQKKDVLRTGFTVEMLGDDDFYGFTLSGDGRFLLGDFTVTHNCGKTVCFASLANRVHEWSTKRRVLIIAHREELIRQAAQKVQSITGEMPDIEMAGERADINMFHTARVVIASKDTLRGDRLKRFNPNDFGLMVTDEAHRSVADSYQGIYTHFDGVPHLGVTATPDRYDEEKLGKVFDSVAYDYGLVEAIPDGWLCPIRQRAVEIHGLDYSKVRTTAGDLNGRDLAEVLSNEQVLQEQADATLNEARGRKTMVFATPGYKSEGEDKFRVSERLTEIFNRHKPGIARLVTGETPKDERQQTLKDYRDGLFQILVNVAVFTEGFDDPSIELIAMARATKSRSLYTQIVGRATRPLPGTVDGLATPFERRTAIEKSAKPFCEILDFGGNAGNHKLIHVSDILGTGYTEQEIALAEKTVKKAKGAVDVTTALKDARKEIHEKKQQEAKERFMRAFIKGTAQYSVRQVDPFDPNDIDRRKQNGIGANGEAATFPQLNYLKRLGVKTWDGITKRQASGMIAKAIAAKNARQVGRTA